MCEPSPPLTFVLHTGWSPLKTSNYNGQLDVLKVLMKSGANINQANEVTTHICSVIVIYLHKIYMCNCTLVASDKYILVPLFIYVHVTQATQHAGSGL